MSPVGDDPFGRLLTEEIRTLGMRTDGLIVQEGGRSAICNMFLDASGNLKDGVADMGIINSLDGETVRGKISANLMLSRLTTL